MTADSVSSVRGLDAAHEAFNKAIEIFSSTVTKDSKKKATVQSSTSLEDVRRTVLEAKTRYETAHEHSKVSKWLSKFSNRVHFYGNILDVLVQHHPEYVSLAWGAMKFVFVVISQVRNHSSGAETPQLVVNNETLTRFLAKGLCQIADSLPQIELVTVLYPTTRLKQAVSELYALVIRFLLRARDWYQESKAMHVLHSLTRPVELRYADLVEDIGACARTVYRLASAAAQAEQRDIHLKMQELIRTQKDSDAVVKEVRSLLISKWRSSTKHLALIMNAMQSIPVSQLQRAPGHQSTTLGLAGITDYDLYLWLL